MGGMYPLLHKWKLRPGVEIRMERGVHFPMQALDIGFKLDRLVKPHEKRLCNLQCCKAFNDLSMIQISCWPLIE